MLESKLLIGPVAASRVLVLQLFGHHVVASVELVGVMHRVLHRRTALIHELAIALHHHLLLLLAVHELLLLLVGIVLILRLVLVHGWLLPMERHPAVVHLLVGGAVKVLNLLLLLLLLLLHLSLFIGGNEYLRADI